MRIHRHHHFIPHGDVDAVEQHDLRPSPRVRQEHSPIDCQSSARAELLFDNGHGMLTCAPNTA